MSDTDLLIDNDVVIKLAQMRAYDDAISALGYQRHRIGSLRAMLRYMGKSSHETRLKFMRSVEGANLFGQVLNSIREIEPTEQESRLAGQLMKRILLEELDMDEGEVALMAIAILRPQPALATGDKRALIDVPALAIAETCVNKMQGRLICFEQIIKCLVAEHGMPRLRTAIANDRKADSMITQAYDNCAAQGAAYFMAALDFVIAHQLAGLNGKWLKPL